MQHTLAMASMNHLNLPIEIFHAHSPPVNVSFLLRNQLQRWLNDSTDYISAFSSGHDLRVLGSSPASGSLQNGQPSFSLSTVGALSLSLKYIHKIFKKEKGEA